MITATDPAPRPTALRRVGRAAVTLLVVAHCLFWVLLAFGTRLDRQDAMSPFQVVTALAGFLVGLAATGVLVLRRRHPAAIGYATAAVLVLPTAPIAALHAAACAAARLPVRRSAPVLAAAVAATTLGVIWDATAPQPFLAMLVSGGTGDPNTHRGAILALSPLIALLLAAPFIGTGLLRRLVSERDDATVAAERSRAETTDARAEVITEQVRKEAAREIHDTLAARLSALSLHAGALELAVPADDARAAEAARVVRTSAQASLEDLRDAIATLRAPTPTGAATSLVDTVLAEVDRARADGTALDVVVGLDDRPMHVDSAHAWRRIVGEVLTNARRHAPGERVRLDLRGGPATGVVLTASNGWPRTAAPAGGGHGLIGIRERAEAAGGEASVTSTADAFTVVVRIPWRNPEV